MLYWLVAGSYFSWDVIMQLSMEILFQQIQWGSTKSSYPWFLADLEEEVQDISSQLGASFLHIYQGANDVAYGLAREGVLRLQISFDI